MTGLTGLTDLTGVRPVRRFGRGGSQSGPGARSIVIAAAAAFVVCATCTAGAAGIPRAEPISTAVAVLMAQAEQALVNGDTAAATVGFERAAAMRHDGAIEMGLVRAALQAGEFRQALAFCAHTAGAHADEPSAGALYAWLLRAAGQPGEALRVLAQTQARAPHDAVVEATRQAFKKEVPIAAGVLLLAPHRMAPQALMQGAQPALPDDARTVAAGVLVGGGQAALVPVMAIEGARRIWVRNGLGRATEAVPDGSAAQALREHGVTLLRLLEPLPLGATTLAPRDPFAGSPGFVIGYPAAADSMPAWPTLREGFLGAADGREGLRKLGIEWPSALHGGPVFDAAGRLAGVSLQGVLQEAAASGRQGASMLPVSMFRALAQAASGLGPKPPANAAAMPGRIPADVAYEQALTVALQVIVQR